MVGEELGKPFRPHEVLFIDGFPKTQSGKIIRRAVQAIHVGEDLGDLSSIENPKGSRRGRETPGRDGPVVGGHRYRHGHLLGFERCGRFSRGTQYLEENLLFL